MMTSETIHINLEANENVVLAQVLLAHMRWLGTQVQSQERDDEMRTIAAICRKACAQSAGMVRQDRARLN